MAIEADLNATDDAPSENDRAVLARQPILSLGTDQIDTDYEKAWELEIERRLVQVDRGDVELIDCSDAIERARNAIRGTGA